MHDEIFSDSDLSTEIQKKHQIEVFEFLRSDRWHDSVHKILISRVYDCLSTCFFTLKTVRLVVDVSQVLIYDNTISVRYLCITEKKPLIAPSYLTNPQFSNTIRMPAHEISIAYRKIQK